MRCEERDKGIVALLVESFFQRQISVKADEQQAYCLTNHLANHWPSVDFYLQDTSGVRTPARSVGCGQGRITLCSARGADAAWRDSRPREAVNNEDTTRSGQHFFFFLLYKQKHWINFRQPVFFFHLLFFLPFRVHFFFFLFLSCLAKFRKERKALALGYISLMKCVWFSWIVLAYFLSGETNKQKKEIN